MDWHALTLPPINLYTVPRRTDMDHNIISTTTAHSIYAVANERGIPEVDVRIYLKDAATEDSILMLKTKDAAGAAALAKLMNETLDGADLFEMYKTNLKIDAYMETR